MIVVIYIVSLLASIWYINTYVLSGSDKQLIFVRVIALILCISILAVILLKIIAPNDLNSDNITTMLSLVKDMTLLIVGYLFAKNQNDIK
jgi:hypothetical protein